MCGSRTPLGERSRIARRRRTLEESVCVMNKAHILIIVQNLPVPFDRRVWQEATSLQRAGFEVSVICPKKKIYTKGYELLDGVHIYRYPLFYEADRGILGYFAEFAYCWLAALVLSVRVFARKRFHVIHACNPPDTYFALAALFRPFGVKFVFDNHDLCPEMYIAKGRPREGLLYRALVWLERRTMQAADFVIAVNQSHRDIAVRRGGADPAKVRIVRSGPRKMWSELNGYTPELKRGRKYMSMYLGEMCKQDGVDYLLRAITHYRKLPGAAGDTLFAFVGGGPDQPRMQQMAEELGLSDVTHFTGRVPDEVLWQYLSTADVCADPDPYSEWSNLSTMNKMIEYLAFGRPVVAFDLRENRNTAADCAVYIQPNDEVRMGEELRALILDEPRRAAMGANGRERFRNTLAWEVSENELICLYSDLLGQPKPAANAHEAAAEAE